MEENFPKSPHESAVSSSEPWHSPDVVRSFIAYALVIIGLAVIMETRLEYSFSGTAPSTLILTPAVGLVTTVAGYYFGNAGTSRAEKAKERVRGDALRFEELYRELLGEFQRARDEVVELQ